MKSAVFDSHIQFNVEHAKGRLAECHLSVADICYLRVIDAWQTKPMILDPVQIRVLGTLIEKEIVTPETYPLSLNALVAGCNQKSSRDPVTELTEEQVRQALHALEEQNLVSVVRDSRVAKFENHARTVFDLRRDDTAVLCLLLLRGAQTPGELRARSERLYTFDGIEAVEATLARLASERPMSEDSSQTSAMRPLVSMLAKQPGSRESRYVHLLGDNSSAGHVLAEPTQVDPRSSNGLAERVQQLEVEVAELRECVRKIESKLGNVTTGAPSETVAADDSAA